MLDCRLLANALDVLANQLLQQRDRPARGACRHPQQSPASPLVARLPVIPVDKYLAFDAGDQVSSGATFGDGGIETGERDSGDHVVLDGLKMTLYNADSTGGGSPCVWATRSSPQREVPFITDSSLGHFHGASRTRQIQRAAVRHPSPLSACRFSPSYCYRSEIELMSLTILSEGITVCLDRSKHPSTARLLGLLTSERKSHLGDHALAAEQAAAFPRACDNDLLDGAIEGDTLNDRWPVTQVLSGADSGRASQARRPGSGVEALRSKRLEWHDWPCRRSTSVHRCPAMKGQECG